jgi:hypothetical protein
MHSLNSADWSRLARTFASNAPPTIETEMLWRRVGAR